MPPESEKENPTRGMKLEDASEETNTSGKSWFFGIGINTYKHFPPLNNAVGDVETILKVLQEKYHVDEAVTLFNQNATRRNIFEQLKRLEKELAEDDKLLILFSGHGFLGTGGGHWVPHEAELGYDFEYLSNFYLKVYLKNIKARHILVISDSCFSGSLFTEGATRKIKGPEERLEHLKSRYGFCSGRHNEEVWDGPKGGHSPFAGSIIEILNENQQSLFRASVFAEKVLDRTTAQYRQLPRHGPLFEVGDKGGQYIFRLKNDEQAAFETAQERNSISAYSGFIRKYSKGTYADMALNRIVALEEDQAWKEVKNLDRISGYFLYMKRYPEGRYLRDAERAIDRLDRGPDETSKTSTSTQRSINIQQSSQEKSVDIQKQNNSSNTFTDPRDGQNYKTVIINGLRWMSQNFNFDAGESCWFYKNDSQYGQKYGRLYSWESAKKACPSGWRLPTQREWMDLIKHAEQVAIDGSDFRSIAYQFLTSGGGEGFSVELGGNRSIDGIFGSIGDFGYYWGDAEDSSEKAPYYGFNRKKNLITRGKSKKSIGRSCRYVQFINDTPKENRICLKSEEPETKKAYLSSKGDQEEKYKLFTDPRDNKAYKTIEINGLCWMAQNLNFDVGEGSWFYENDPKKGGKYGRLYTWEAAKKACPPGWRLPTDFEWRKMAKDFGGVYGETLNNGKTAYQSLIAGGDSGFAAKLGGFRAPNGNFVNLGGVGHFWSSREFGSNYAWNYTFFLIGRHLTRSRNRKAWGFSCRCVQDLPI